MLTQEPLQPLARSIGIRQGLEKARGRADQVIMPLSAHPLDLEANGVDASKGGPSPVDQGLHPAVKAFQLRSKARV
ncbi:hypothetical protein GCM10023317_46910 [Actinopolymorpha pittospori]|uniref:Uncharacterized protein n=1 Tax=Actinopolymorpha pittospori TaxID=648752 RepID=A0A927MVR2_9ACTN|nr:hypothetical protein [Actinopolymorpha pittospori]